MQQMDFGPNEKCQDENILFHPQLDEQTKLKTSHLYLRARLVRLDGQD